MLEKIAVFVNSHSWWQLFDSHCFGTRVNIRKKMQVKSDNKNATVTSDHPTAAQG